MKIAEGDEVSFMRVGAPPARATVLRVDGPVKGVTLRVHETGKRMTIDAARIMVDRQAPSIGTLTSRPSYDAAPGVAVPKQVPTRSKGYLAFVRERPCCACAAPAPSDPHHWAIKGSGGGMGTKADDLRTVPLCRACHDHFHQHAALPFKTVVETRVLFLAKQVDLLVAWHQQQENKT